jgi:hypothetical protein
MESSAAFLGFCLSPEGRKTNSLVSTLERPLASSLHSTHVGDQKAGQLRRRKEEKVLAQGRRHGRARSSLARPRE